MIYAAIHIQSWDGPHGLLPAIFTAEQMTLKETTMTAIIDFEIKILDSSELKIVLETPG